MQDPAQYKLIGLTGAKFRPGCSYFQADLCIIRRTHLLLKRGCDYADIQGYAIRNSKFGRECYRSL